MKTIASRDRWRLYPFAVTGLLRLGAALSIVSAACCTFHALPAFANEAPVAAIAVNPASGASPLEVIFDASASYDADGWIASFEWDLNGDGSFTLNSATFPFVYAYFSLDSSETITASVRVTDSLGATAIASTQIEIKNGIITTDSQPENEQPTHDHQPTFPLVNPPADTESTPYLNDAMSDGNWLHACYAPIPVRTDGARSYQSEQITQMADEVLAIVNRERQAAGLNPLKWGYHLEFLAQAQARDMALRGYFDHTNLLGMTPSDRLNAISPPRWSYSAENIAAGNQTAQEVMDGWMNSPGHRANILSPDASFIGVGCYYLANDPQYYGYYWVQVFASFFNDPSGNDWLDPNEVE